MRQGKCPRCGRYSVDLNKHDILTSCHSVRYRVRGWLKELLFGWIPDYQQKRQMEKRLDRIRERLK